MQESNSATVVDLKKVFFEDKNFILKLIFLAALIVVLSLYLIFQGFNVVNKLAAFKEKPAYITLDEIEKSYNSTKKIVDEIDLKGIEFASNKKESLIHDPFLLELLEKDISHNLNKQKSQKKRVITDSTNYAPAAQVQKPKLIIKSKKVNGLQFLKKKFNATSSSKYAVMLAQEYYDRKNYKQAMRWALITNEIDNENETSWLLFAQSKVKLNQKSDAVKALTSYLKLHDSTKVERVLKQIQVGV